MARLNGLRGHARNTAPSVPPQERDTGAAVATIAPDVSDVRSGEPRGSVDLCAIWDSSLAILQEQVAVIERTVVAALELRLDLGCQREAGRDAHKLAGSLGTFGFNDGSRLARSLELAFASEKVVEPSQALKLSELVVDLRVEIARPVIAPPAMVETGPSEVGHASLLVIDTDDDRQRRVIETAVGRGMHCSRATNLAAARALVAADPPHVAVVYAGVGGSDEVSAFLADMAAHRPVISTVLLAGEAALSDRVAATQAGAAAILEAPLQPESVVAAVSRLIARQRSAAKVLVVDDDPIFLAVVGKLLGAHGFAVESLDDAGRLWDRLEEIEPDLVLLDNQMPGVDGISLCKAIRSDERWARLPVVFLSGSDSPVVVREMFAAGADDFVSKPVSAADLTTRVTNRIQRSRAQTERADVDLATGLPGAGTFVTDATRLLGVARQDGRTAVLAVIELTPPGEQALASFGRLVRQASEPQDAVGIWTGRRLAVLSYGTTAAQAQVRLREILSAAGAAGGASAPTVKVGLAAFPDEGSDIATLGVAAQAALLRARPKPGDTIEGKESPALGLVEVVDVLVVDDDEVLGNLVVQSLSAAGMSVRWLQDGAKAVELMDDPRFRARAVLLDVGLPGLDGLSVLRHLARKGMLRTTRVVMLTVRTNDEEVLASLDLGAFDHIAKPFSLSVLIHRIRRALEASG